MPVTYTLTVPPTEEPVTIQEAKRHLREEGATEQDAVIEGLVAAAREYVEHSTGRQLAAATARERFDCFPEDSGPIRLSGVPVRAVSSITYVDADGVTQTLDAGLYRADVESEPARIEPAYGAVWPTAREVVNAVTVTYTVGYADRASIPQAAKQAMLLLVGHWFENREAVVVGTVTATLGLAVEALVDKYAVYTR